jgi:hypothetical protein
MIATEMAPLQPPRFGPGFGDLHAYRTHRGACISRG